MNRRKFLKRGSLFVPAALCFPHIVKAQTFVGSAAVRGAAALQSGSSGGGGGGGGGNIVVDYWQDFEFTTLNTGNLDAHDHSSTGSWSINDTATQLVTGTGAQHAMISTVNSATDTGTRGLIYTANNAARASVNYTFGTAPNANAVSFGMWVYVPSAGSNYSPKIVSFYNVVAVRLRRLASVYSFCWDDLSGDLPVPTADTWYWMTCLIQKSATCKLRAYNTSGVQVGSETTFAGRGNNLSDLIWPNIDGGDEGGIVINMDNMVFDQTSFVYPLGP